MESEPRMDASRPSKLRLAAFALTAVGALVMGIGSLLTWVTVGIADQTSVQTDTPGTDLPIGLFTLVCAVVILVVVVMSRMVRERARTVLAIVVIAIGAIVTALAAWFVAAAPDFYSPVDNEKLVSALAAVYQRTPEEIRAALSDVIDQLGGYTHVGPGPWVVIIGGVVAAAGGVLTLRWARGLRTLDVNGEAMSSVAEPPTATWS